LSWSKLVKCFEKNIILRYLGGWLKKVLSNPAKNLVKDRSTAFNKQDYPGGPKKMILYMVQMEVTACGAISGDDNLYAMKGDDYIWSELGNDYLSTRSR
jgi:hypothetical protein